MSSYNAYPFGSAIRFYPAAPPLAANFNLKGLTLDDGDVRSAWRYDRPAAGGQPAELALVGHFRVFPRQGLDADRCAHSIAQEIAVDAVAALAPQVPYARDLELAVDLDAEDVTRGKFKGLAPRAHDGPAARGLQVEGALPLEHDDAG
jgi:hypothetical protein